MYVFEGLEKQIAPAERCPIEVSAMIRVFCICSLSMEATRPMWLLSTRTMASVTEELNFKFYFIFNH